MTDRFAPIRRILPMLSLLGWLMTGCTTIHPVLTEDVARLDGKRFPHAHFDKVLEAFVDGRGLVDYPALREDPHDLEAYYGLIGTYSPDSHPDLFPSTNHKLAYWINAYNAAAIKTVLTYYPIESVLEVQKPALFFFISDKAGFFYFQRLRFGGRTTSLYYLENSVIRRRFGDPRIHFALNCASLGCPRLPRQSFVGDFLDRQLDRETRRFLAEERNFTIDHDKKVIYLSSIFQWYQEDFTSWYAKTFPGRAASLLGYIDLYLAPEKSAMLQRVGDHYALRFTPYDWRLNDQGAVTSTQKAGSNAAEQLLPIEEVHHAR